LETKLRVLEKQRLEDRDKLKALDRVQQERDKFESIIQKIQAKYQPVHQENNDLKKQLRESEVLAERIEVLQEEHDVQLEEVVLEREMAEERAENASNEVADLKQRVEELELENEILKDENTELGKDISPEEKTSASWVQMEHENERLRDAIIRLRDVSRADEASYKKHVKSLEEDSKELAELKAAHEELKVNTLQIEADNQDLREQLDAALSAEEIIEDLSDQNSVLKEKVEELKLVIDDLQDLKDLNDELEINHIEHAKELRQELDIKDTEIAAGRRAVEQFQTAIDAHEYSITKYREAFGSLSSDFEQMRANKEISEIEKMDLAQRSKELAEINLKLAQSATNTMVTTIDMELRKLDAQEATQHLAIVQLFLPEAFQSERDSVLGLLRCRRIAFKARLLHGLIKEPLTSPGKPSIIRDEDIFEACAALNQLVLISEMADSLNGGISSCDVEQFARFGSQGAIFELEPVERALDAKIDALRKNDFQGRNVAQELQRSAAVLKHLAAQHAISSASADAGAHALKMSVELIRSNLDVATIGLTLISYEVEQNVQNDSDEDGVSRFTQKSDAIIAATRSANIVVGKTMRALQDLRTRSLSLNPDTHAGFEACERSSAQVAEYCRVLGNNLLALLKQEGLPALPSFSIIRNILFKTTEQFFPDSPIDSDIYSSLSAKVRAISEELSNLHATSTTLNRTIEFERSPEPWVLKSKEIAASKLVSIDAENEIQRLQGEVKKHGITIKIREQSIEEKAVEIETLQSRIRDASKKVAKIQELENDILKFRQQQEALINEREKRDREIRRLEQERERWADAARMQSKLSDHGSATGARASTADTQALERELAVTKQALERLRKSVAFLRKENSAIVRADKQHRSARLNELAERQLAEDDRQRVEAGVVVIKPLQSMGTPKVLRNKLPKYLTASLLPARQAASRTLALTLSVQSVAKSVANLTPVLRSVEMTPKSRENRLKWTPKSKTPQSQLDAAVAGSPWGWSPWTPSTVREAEFEAEIRKASRLTPVNCVTIGSKWVLQGSMV
jgi:dynactin 1